MKWRTDWKVGDECLMFDDNRRVYERGTYGRVIGGPIYREHFVKNKIVGETRVSWLVTYPSALPPYRHATKISKTTGEGLYDDAMADEAAWVRDHKHRITNLMAHTPLSADTLRKIAELIGYKP